MKSFKVVTMFILILTLLTSSVFAGPLSFPVNPQALVSVVSHTQPVVNQLVVDKYQITDVKVRGMSAELNNKDNVIYVERGQRVSVEVFFRGSELCSVGEDNACYDTRLRAYFGGYEYGVVEDTSEIFQVLPGVNDHKVLYLQMPNDLEASELYTLNIEMFDDEDSVRQKFYVRVEEPRHEVNIFDTIFNPTGAVRAGDALFASVRVENLGDNTEESVKVTVSVPQLGIRTSEYVDLLVTEQESNSGGISSSRRTSATSNDLLLMIPQDTVAGNYEVVVTVEYNRGHDVAEKKYTLQVASPRVVVQNTPSVRVNVASTLQALRAGESGSFTFSVSNLGQEPVTVTFDASGVEGWGTLNVNPGSVTVSPNTVKDVVVTVFANEGIEGTKLVSVNAKVNGNNVAQESLTVSVTKSAGSSETVKKVLIAGFLVLLGILVILAIILVVKKLTSDDEEGRVEGQTYY